MHYDEKTLNYKGKVIFKKVTTGDFKRKLKFFYEKEACFMFIEDGSFQLRTPEKTIQFKSGEGLLSKCGNCYFERPGIRPLDGNMRMTVLGAYFYPSIVKELFAYDLSLSDFRTNYDSSKILLDSLLIHFKNSLHLLLDNPSLSSDALILTKKKEFLLLLARTESGVAVKDFIASLYQPYEYDFKSIIEQNLYASLSLQEFAQLSNMSLSTFKRKFVKIYGTSPKKYLIQKKIDYACHLLQFEEHKIITIAYDTGFDSISSFNRAFKNAVGLSPSQYRLNQNA